jgi:hypothetical protein
MAKGITLNIDGMYYRGSYWIMPSGMVEFHGFALEDWQSADA